MTRHRRPSTSMLLLALSGLLLLPTLSAAQTYDSADSTPAATSLAPGSARPGWTLSAGLGGASLDLDDSVTDRLDPLGFTLTERGSGVDFAVGYSFSDQLSLDLRLSGRSLGTGRDDIDANFAQFMLEVSAPLQPRARVTPYVTGGVGAAALILMGDEIDDRALDAGQLSFGGGLEVRLSARFALDLHYRAGVLSFQNENVDLAQGDETIEIEGQGISHSWGLRTVFSF